MKSFMLYGGLCYMEVYVIWRFMLYGGSCYMEVHGIYQTDYMEGRPV